MGQEQVNELVGSRESVAQEALRLLSSVPKEEWITGKYTDRVGKCCGAGHYCRLKRNPESYSMSNCSEDLSFGFIIDIKRFLEGVDLFMVNDGGVEKYNQDNPKDRVIALLEDMVKAGY